MPPISSTLIILSFILVILPSVFVIFLRIALYKHLTFLEQRVRRLINRQERGQQPKIIEDLERRFAHASKNLDHVNTTALIEDAYSREKIRFITCEQIDYLCRTLPNLLLAFGLFGTFVGITFNLYTLGQTINQTDATNVTTLVAELEKPLQGMSIAFVSSLIALCFSALLTVINLSRNTNLLKYRLISCLEDYLDNIYQPQVQGDTRLDKIVNRMVSQQERFLANFGNTVRTAVETSLGKVTQQIADSNKEVADLAKQVYESFTQSAGTISAAANEFKFTIEELNQKADIFKQAADTFDQSQFPAKLSEATADLATIQENFSHSTVSLAEATTAIATVVKEVQSYSQELINLGTEIKEINATSVQVLNLHQNNQQSLSEIIPQLKQGGASFSKAVNKLDKLEQRITNDAESLEQLIDNVKTYTQQVNSAIEMTGDRLISNLSQQLGTNQKQTQTVIANLEGYANQLSVKLDTLTLDMVQLIKDNNAGYKTVGNSLIAGVNNQTVEVTTSIQECINNLKDTKFEIYRLRQNLEKVLEKTPDTLDGLNKI
ncbi:MAG: hypothetical protein KME28_20590 [Pelatocladus maniniholoensis HA4357-MV3]|jgi:chromosome segregation ATPase|uniref:MotA/TolQ/ExbB proton channel domain-containing protein n=1 Tax=Pelatocladus maniniholoensis HA4357-MV3 TaxID=1117104 RepID=A0A9E3HB37_9NOST|nr:hypothetical protein [Pelatocladus maniniholoensis HA4357-MV3]